MVYILGYIAVIVTVILIHQLISQRKIMATFDEVISQIDTAATAAGQRVDALISSIKANGQVLTAEQEAEASAIVAHLTALGADPANPVPAAPATEETTA